MGSPDVRRGASIWPPFSPSQQGQSKIGVSIQDRRLPSRCLPQMTPKRKNSSEALVNAFGVGVGSEKNPLKLEDLGDDENAMLMSAHLQMLQNFMKFCSQKKVKYNEEHPDTANPKLHEDKNKYFESNSFRERVTSYFGEYLPSSVVDELCQLIDENSYGKCHYCSLPAESLVLSVLQILLNASQNLGSKAQSSQGLSQNCINETHNTNAGTKAAGSENSHFNKKSFIKKPPPPGDIVDVESVSLNMSVSKHSLLDKAHDQSAQENPLPTLDTPGFLPGKDINGNISVLSQQAPAMPMDPKWRHNRFISELCHPAGPPSKVASPEVYIVKETKSKDICPDLGKLADQIYNKKNLNILPNKTITDAASLHHLQMDLSSTKTKGWDIILLAFSSIYIYLGKFIKLSIFLEDLGEGGDSIINQRCS